jgi:glutathione S-transferase
MKEGETMTKGYATPSSPFARKVRMAQIETDQPNLIEWQMLTREERAALIPSINPLGKVPCVVLDNGEALYDSPVICAWVDAQHGGNRLIPDTGHERWRVLCLEALGDGMGEAVVAVALEQAKDEGARSQAVIDRQSGKVKSALAALNEEAPHFRDPVTVGEIAVACAIGYMEFRGVAGGWRDAFPALGGWYDGLADRPSFAETLP